MTDNIYPPDHLLRKWESLIIDEEQNVDVVLYEAFQAGADQELEACCKLLELSDSNAREFLTAARRPKSSSLKEQALKEMDKLDEYWEVLPIELDSLDVIRKALEALMDDRRETHALATEARAALAQPEPEGPTDEEIMELMPQQMRDDLAAAARALSGFDPDNIKAASVFRIILNRHAVDHARAVLARWGNHPESSDSSTQPS